MTMARGRAGQGRHGCADRGLRGAGAGRALTILVGMSRGLGARRRAILAQIESWLLMLAGWTGVVALSLLTLWSMLYVSYHH
jgi:hypothetical protein